jgi:hypothetical protein
MEEILLSEQFDCMFDLAETKSHSVVKMFSLGWGPVAWVWRR